MLAEVITDGSKCRMDFHAKFAFVANHLPLLEFWNVFQVSKSLFEHTSINHWSRFCHLIFRSADQTLDPTLHSMLSSAELQGQCLLTSLIPTKWTRHLGRRTLQFMVNSGPLEDHFTLAWTVPPPPRPHDFPNIRAKLFLRKCISQTEAEGRGQAGKKWSNNLVLSLWGTCPKLLSADRFVSCSYWVLNERKD